MPRYRFDAFVLSPRRRVLLRDGQDVPLIPRYFDLLLFLVERRGGAVHRRDIFDGVWTDVVVSDSALSQAVRTIRRALGDDSREPRYVRTVSRHGYQFVFTDVVEEAEDGPWPGEPPSAAPAVAAPTTAREAQSPLVPPSPEPFDALLARLTAGDASDDARDAAEQLHALGTAEALRRLGTRPGHAQARALLRDARWAVPGAGAVPLLGAPGAAAAAAHLVGLRLHHAARLATTRCAAAALFGGLAGATAGAVGGVALTLAPGSIAPVQVIAVLAAVGAGAGALAGGGVSAGMAAAEAVARSPRARVPALAAGGALGGAAIGALVQWLGRWTLTVLTGTRVPLGGAWEGLVLGGMAAIGYAVATAGVTGGIPAPRGGRRVLTVAATSVACALGALALALAGLPLVGGSLHAVATAAAGGGGLLTPLARLIGEPDFGRVTAALIGTGEGAAFGAGLALGLTRRP